MPKASFRARSRPAQAESSTDGVWRGPSDSRVERAAGRHDGSSSVERDLPALLDLALEAQVLAMDDREFARALAAVQRHDRRCAGTEVPDGRPDACGHWLPSPDEDAGVTSTATAPSRTLPHAYLLACQSLEHCAALDEAGHEAALLVKRWLLDIGLQHGRPPSHPAEMRAALQLQRALQGMPDHAPARRLRL